MIKDLGAAAVLVAAIGAAGTVVGAVATVLVARMQAAAKNSAKEEDLPATSPVLGHAVDIRELRILRALFGEQKGRILESYKVKYYLPALEAVAKKKLVAVVDGRYHLTSKGADFCRAYFKELLVGWQPSVQVHAAPESS